MYKHHNHSGGALILRLLLGVVFMYHGWIHVSHMEITAKFFGIIGVGGMAEFVSWLELIGGALIFLGILIKPVCVALATVMAVVVFGLPPKHPDLFLGHELEFVLLVSLLSLYIGGPGKYSVSACCAKKCGCDCGK